MEFDRVSALNVQQIERGALFFLGRRGSPALCIRGFKKEPDGSESERVIPLRHTDDPRGERRPIYASSLSGMGVLVQDARVVPDLSSITHTSMSGYGSASLYVCDHALYLPLVPSGFDEPMLNLATGEVLDALPDNRPWVGVGTWRIEAGREPTEVVFEERASAEGE